jgi:hypothetical protein
MIKKNIKQEMKIIKKHHIAFIIVVVLGLDAPIFMGLDTLAGLVLSSSYRCNDGIYRS